MASDPFLLDDQPLDGTHSIQRILGPGRHSVVTATDLSEIASEISTRCGIWGGASHPIAPIEQVATSGLWRDLLESADPEVVTFANGRIDPGLHWKQRWSPAVPVAVIIAALLDEISSLATLRIPEIPEDDPWFIAYRGVLGSLPDDISKLDVQMTRLKPNLRYDELLPVEREEVLASGEDLLSRLREHVTPVSLSLTLLSRLGGEKRPTFARIASALGSDIRALPSTVVVYRPGSAEDLLLIWALRSAWGWPFGFPLAVPLSKETANVIRTWVQQRAGSSIRLAPGPTGALVSFSVGSSVLTAIAAELGDKWIAQSPDEALFASPPPGRVSSDLAIFDKGRAELQGWGSEDIRMLGRHLSRYSGLGMVVRLHPLGLGLPPIRSYAKASLNDEGYHFGAYQAAVGDPQTFAPMHWPTGWTVVRAFARDRGLEVRPSAAGRAGEAFFHLLEVPGEASFLSSPAIVKHLYRLGERSGITWFKHRFKQLVAGLDQIVDQEVRLNLIESRIDQLAASTEDADLHSITTSALNDIGNREQVREWLTWAESRRILVRGADIVCGRCGARRWRAMAELAPPVVCSSCGEVVEAPFDQTNLHFKYRASETLVRLTELDALGHVLTLDWLTQLFQRQPELCGGHPGVEFLRGGEVIGEADILLLFNDGACAVGEYKRSGSGLNETELAKLDNLADTLDADWTFVATHEAAADCPEIWVACQRTLPKRPRMALSGDALYSQPIWLLGENPFSWANESGQPMRRVLDPAGNAEWFRRMAHPDSELFDSWEFMDRQPAPDGGESSN